MTWVCYQVSLRLLSSLHIGWRKTGNLQQTRSYIIGKALWGALTARLVRDQNNTNYEEIGRKVDNELRFTYFYPTTIPDKVEIWPWDKLDYFSWLYLNSYASTALQNQTAEEGTLHETEYISPKTREGKQVYLMGYIIEKDCCNLYWRNTFNRLRLGGERGYGWGRIELINSLKKCSSCFDYAFNGVGDFPIIKVPKNKPILAHTFNEGLNCKGKIEPLIGRETTKNKGFGGVISKAEICWIPGSVVKNDKIFEIHPKGIWKLKEEK